MTSEELRADLSIKIRQIIADDMGTEIDHVHEHSRIIDDLGADSLDTVEIVMEIEDEFDIGTILDADAEKWITVKDVIDFVHYKMEN